MIEEKNTNQTGKIVDAVGSSTFDIFNTMLSMEVNIDPASKPSFLPVEKDSVSGDICGIVGIGGKMTGAIAILVNEKVGIKIASQLLEENITEVNEDVLGSIGEMTNMIAGGIKTALTEDEDLFELAIPIVIRNEEKIIHHLNDKCRVLTIPFLLENDTFFVKIYLL